MPAHSPKRRDCGGRCSHQLCCSFGQCCTLTMPADFSCVTSPTDPESYHSTTVCSGFPAKKQRRSAARRAIFSAVVLTILSICMPVLLRLCMTMQLRESPAPSHNLLPDDRKNL